MIFIVNGHVPSTVRLSRRELSISIPDPLPPFRPPHSRLTERELITAYWSTSPPGRSFFDPGEEEIGGGEERGCVWVEWEGAGGLTAGPSIALCFSNILISVARGPQGASTVAARGSDSR